MLDEMEKMLNLRCLIDLILPDPLHSLLQCQARTENDTISFLQTPQRLIRKAMALEANDVEPKKFGPASGCKRVRRDV
jgi:hypothetical protein